MPVPNTFATATAPIPLSQLDANFATAITLGNTAIQLGNTVTTLNNMTLANVTISSGNVTITNVSVTTANVATANVTTSQILNYGTANGVAYLNTNKALTTGTSLVFDGTNLGIGTSSPNKAAISRTLTINGAANAGLELAAGDSLYGLIFANASRFSIDTNNTGSNIINFYTSGSERARITSSGDLWVGTSSGGGARLRALNQITITGRNLIGWIGGAGSWSVNGYEELGVGYSGIRSIYISADDWALAFSTGTSAQFNAGTQSERARITSGGYFKASNTGTYQNSTASYHELRNDANQNTVRISNTITSGYTDSQVQIQFTGYTPNATNSWFLYCNDTTNQKAGILTTGTFESRTSTYGGVSDIKLKQDIVDASSQWDDVKAVRVRKFRFKDDSDSALQLGVVAQELETVSPGLVYETPDYEELEVIDEEGNITKERQPTGTSTKSVKYSILYMKAVKALQEAMTRIEQLEAKVAALENA